MGLTRRTFLDPEYETEITVSEAPLELEGGGVSRRVKVWLFENQFGSPICQLEVHRTANLGQLSEVELEEVYLYALRVG